MKDTLANRIESMHQRLATRTAMIRKRAFQAAMDKKIAAEASKAGAAGSAEEPDASTKTAAKP